MPSSFSWIDFAETDRQRMTNIIDLFREDETRDELGTGSIRDGLAEILFPGTSTIQTRAKYMLFVPWLCLHLERKKTSSEEFAYRLEKLEIKLIYALEESEDKNGIIGIQAKEKLERFASEVYWAGLQRWGILRNRSFQSKYFREIERFYKRRVTLVTGDERSEDQAGVANWDRVPAAPEDFPEVASFQLNQNEAAYLRERLQLSCANSLLLYLVDQRKDLMGLDFPWEIPVPKDFPPKLARQLNHAELFSLSINGSFLLYNVMLAEKTNNRSLLKEHEANFLEWVKEFQANEKRLRQWSLEDFWKLFSEFEFQIPLRTRNFFQEWHAIATKANSSSLLKLDSARNLIEARELSIKGMKRARLKDSGALSRWQGDSGTGRIGYRWFRVKRIVSDIVAGLTGNFS